MCGQADVGGDEEGGDILLNSLRNSFTFTGMHHTVNEENYMLRIFLEFFFFSFSEVLGG